MLGEGGRAGELKERMAATADEHELDVDSVIERLLGGKHEVQLPSDRV